MISNTNEAQDQLLDEVIDEICKSLEDGWQPDVDKLAEKYPELAGQIRTIFPTLLAVHTLDLSVDAVEGQPIHAGLGTEVLGDFRIVRQIGRGGMGVVYEAEQLSIRRRVALKVLPLAALVDPRALKRFHNEVAAVATLEHPHIVPVYAVGEERGIHYYAMKLIRGQSLSAVIRELRARADRDERLSGEAIQQAVSDIAAGELASSEKAERPEPDLNASTEAIMSFQHENDAREKKKEIENKKEKQEEREKESGQKYKFANANEPEPDPEHEYEKKHETKNISSPSPPSRGRGQGEGEHAEAIDTVARGKSNTLRQVTDQTYFRNVAKLIQQAAEALQHAHDQGIIHRDIKPGNLLLDTNGTLYVTDFGLARIETVAGVTMTGDVLGTLRYMSPEQVQGNRFTVDHRTDIYSLGATLYELLTLQPIWHGDDKAELIRQISFEEPTRPQKIDATIPPDLVTIVLKALNKNPNERYYNAQTFAHDLGSFLTLKPIVARRPNTVQRINKWARRNPAIMWSVTALLLISVVFLSLGVVGLSISRAMIAEKEATTQKALEEARTDAAIAEAVNEFINNDLLGKADPHEEPDRDLKVSQVLERALRTIEGRFPDQPLVEAEIRCTLADALTNLGRYIDAESQLRDVAKVLARELGSNARETVEVEFALAWNEHEKGNYAACFKLLAPLYDRALALFGKDDELSVVIACQLGDLHHHLGRLDEAEKVLREALAINARTIGSDHLKNRILWNLARVARSQGRIGQAEELFRRACELSGQDLGPEHPQTLSVRTKLAELLLSQDNFAEATHTLTEVQAIRERVQGPTHPATVQGMTMLGGALLESGEIDKAAPMLERAVNISEATFGPDHHQTLNALVALAQVYRAKGQFNQSIRLYERVLKRHETVTAADVAADLKWKNGLALNYGMIGDFAKETALLEEVFPAAKIALGDGHPITLTIAHNLANAYKRVGLAEKAVPIAEELVRLERLQLGPEELSTLKSVIGLAASYMDTGDFPKAIHLAEETVNQIKAKLGENHPETLDATKALAVMYWKANQLDMSIPLFERSLSYFEEKYGRDNPLTQEVVLNLGVNYMDAGRVEDALPLLIEGYNTQKANPSVAGLGIRLIEAHLRKADIDKAKAVADELMEKTVPQIPQGSPLRGMLLASLSRYYLLPMAKYVEAERLLLECTGINETNRLQEWRKFNAKSLLGAALLGQGRFAEAESHLIAGYDGLFERRALILPIARNRLDEAAQRLVKLYEIWDTAEPDQGYRAKAEHWRQQVEELNKALSDVTPK